MAKKILAVEIGSGNIKLLYGSSKKIKKFERIEIQETLMDSTGVIDVEEVYPLIRKFIRGKRFRLRPKGISFAIFGSDVIIRHMEMPKMKREFEKETIDYEIKRNLPNNGDDYYIDYEIQHLKVDKKVKNYSVMSVAVLKAQIDSYMELAKKLKLEVKDIDLSANCTARVYSKLTTGKKAARMVAIIDIGKKNTSISLLENGSLTFERQVMFGVQNLYNELKRSDPEMYDNEFDYICNQYEYEDTLLDANIRISRRLENVFSSFQKVVQFYTNGKTQKDISEIHIIGVGSKIKGIEDVVRLYLTSEVVSTKLPKKLKIKIKKKMRGQENLYINPLGLLMKE